MTSQEFRALCENKIVILDGATGTNLQKAGMSAGVCPENWILEHPTVMKELQKSFLAAGTDILYAPTFTANRVKLAEYGLEGALEEMNTALVKISKQAVKEYELEQGMVGGGESAGRKRHYIAGDLTMTGRLVCPVGDLPLEELIEIYKEQVRVLVAAGVDLFVVETIMSLQECRAAVLAVRETCDLPVMVTLTFAEDGKTMYGTTPKAAVVVLQSLGADAVGVNCSAGPDAMASIVEEMAQVAEVPVIAKPNAGLPKLIDGVTVYDMTPEQFAEHMEKLTEAGAGIIGGCCGSEPGHIAAIAALAKKKQPWTGWKENKDRPAMLATEYTAVPIELDGTTKIIGERINPTGKKALQAELREGKLDLVLQYAREQETAGAYLLDINAGMSGIDEKEMMLRIVEAVMQEVSLPLVLDSSHVEVLEAALRMYPGRAMVNSVSCEKDKMERLLPVVKKYGAMFILLPLSEEGLPKNIEEKHAMIHTVMKEAEKFGILKKDIVVDGLVTTIAANKQAARETLATIRYCKETLQVATSIGLSNISFGLPARVFVNSAFLTMAVEAGLTMAIANPCQKMPMQYLLAADLLMGKEGADLAFIEAAAEMTETIQTGRAEVKKSAESKEAKEQTKEQEQPRQSEIFTAVLKGNKRGILELTQKALQDESLGNTLNMRADKILNQDLISAINEVGRLFELKKYFLPQLIASAEAMELAVKHLEPLLATDEGEKRGTVVIATVKGDVHDIGKNLVALLLKNYGFRVIDLGKDVESEVIVETARKEEADWIALSALMTTTMTRMREVVELRNEAGLSTKIIIGGAVTTEDYAKEIGADAYGRDAQEAVKRLTEGKPEK